MGLLSESLMACWMIWAKLMSLFSAMGSVILCFRIRSMKGAIILVASRAHAMAAFCAWGLMFRALRTSSGCASWKDLGDPVVFVESLGNRIL